MKNLKIVVYAIARNESKFVERWMSSMKEADAVVVLDTGSIDDTVERLQQAGARVVQKSYPKWETIEDYQRLVSEGKRPWRFDWARNDSMDLALEAYPDADILVCTDPDEYFLPGWRARLESAWLAYHDKFGCYPTTASYLYVWNFNPDGSDGSVFDYEKIHAPGVARWDHPVHEVLTYSGDKRMLRVEGLRLEHHADPVKSRGQYLRLLELSVQEAPDDDRNMHYLGREYMFYRQWDKAIETLKRHLALPTAQWPAERASSMRFIGRCYGAKGDWRNQQKWLWKAIATDRNQRESACELAEAAYHRADWPVVVKAAEACLSVQQRVRSYLLEEKAWGALPWGLYALGLWHTRHRVAALLASTQAVAKATAGDTDSWILSNMRYFQTKLSTENDVLPCPPAETCIVASGCSTNPGPRSWNQQTTRLSDNRIVPWEKFFDHIYCFHMVDKTARIPGLLSELQRVGILESGIFSFAYTSADPWEAKLIEAYPDRLQRPHVSNQGFLNLAMANVRIMREALGLGYRRVLLLEDDVRFLKDLYMLRRGLEQTPPDRHFVQYDKFLDDLEMPVEVYRKICDAQSINEVFFDPMGHQYPSSACLMVDQTGMQQLVHHAETVAPDPLDAMPFYCGLLNNKQAAVAKRNLAIQIRYVDGMATEYLGTTRNTHHDRYRGQGLRYEDYAVPEGYGFEVDDSYQG